MPRDQFLSPAPAQTVAYLAHHSLNAADGAVYLHRDRRAQVLQDRVALIWFSVQQQLVDHHGGIFL